MKKRELELHNFKSIVEEAFEGIWLLNEKAETEYINPFMEKILGFSLQEVQNKSLYDFCFPEEIPSIQDKFQHNLEGFSEKFDCRLHAKDGQLVLTLVCMSPTRDSAGKITGVLGMFTDITNRRIAEIALRESEKRFRALADTAPMMIWIAGIDKQYTYFNKSWLNFTGQSFAEELNQGWTKNIHEDDYDFCLATFSAAFDRRETFEMEYRLKRADGVYRWILDRGTPRFNSDGDFLGYIGSCIDISERKENENKLYQLASIIESSDDAIYSADLDGTITTWNKGAEKLFGYSAEEIIGKTLINTVVPQDKKAEFREYKDVLESDGTISAFETVRKRKNGEKIDTLITLSRIKDKQGNTLGASVIARNITANKRAEKERDELLSQLNQLIEIAPIGIAFINENLQYVKINRMLASMNGLSVEEHLNKTPLEVLPENVAKVITKNLKQVLKTKSIFTTEVLTPSPLNPSENRWWTAIYYPIQLTDSSVGIGAIIQDISDQKLIEKRKDDFITMSSHELKTPVTTIKAFTQILQHVVKLEDQRAQNYLAKIDGEVNRLTKLINDFLDLSKIKNGTLRIIKEHFAFDELINEIIFSYQKMGLEQRLEVIGKTNTTVFADRSRISQVFRNLIDNAVKYSPGKKKIKISLAEKNGYAHCSVKDYGIGISKENQKKIFQSFYRVFESETVEFPGLGIGLYISSEIIKAHKGEVAVSSKKGDGALFTFSLPIGK